MKNKHLILLSVICLSAFILRVASPFQNVFGNGFVSFLETDAYNRMYYAVKIHEMPFLQGLTYMAHNSLLFSWMVATLGHVFPIELVGAWLPPVLAVLAIVVVYGIGALAFNRTVGLLAALFVAVIPSEFFHRSLLGFADHHVLEVLLMALVVYCLLKALRCGNGAYNLLGQHQTRPPAGIVARYIFNRWVVLAGVSLLLYLLNWKSGVLLIGILGLYAVVVALHGWIKQHNWLTPCLVAAAPVVIALLLYLPLGGMDRYLFWLPNQTANSTASAVAAITAQEMTNTLFAPVSQRTISELMPLLAPGGTVNPVVVFTNLHLFVVPFLFGIWLLWRCRREPDKLLLLVWALVILAITLNQRRFLYYLTMNVGLLSAMVVYEAAKRIRSDVWLNALLLALPLVLISLPTATSMGRSSAYQMSPEWHQALTWLKDQPDTGYVTAWSDYGHWIKYVSRKDPNLLPGPGGKDVAQLFLSTDTDEAKRLMDKLNTAYLIVDTHAFAMKGMAFVMVSGNPQPDMRSTLMYYLLSYSSPLPFLPMVYESETIRIYRYE